MSEPKQIQCVDDPYGAHPMTIKVAFGMNLASASIALKFVITKFSIGRLLLALFSRGFMRKVILLLRPIFDLIIFNYLSVSVNTMPFPYRTYAGTLIPGGVEVIIDRMVLFHIIKVRKAKFSVGAHGFRMEIFIDPIVLKVAGITLLEITGIKGVEKANAFESIELAKARKAQREHDAAEKARKMALENNKKFYQPFCEDSKSHCGTCAHSHENSTLVIACGSGSDGEFVISEIVDARWAVPELDSAVEVRLFWRIMSHRLRTFCGYLILKIFLPLNQNLILP